MFPGLVVAVLLGLLMPYVFHPRMLPQKEGPPELTATTQTLNRGEYLARRRLHRL